MLSNRHHTGRVFLTWSFHVGSLFPLWVHCGHTQCVIQQIRCIWSQGKLTYLDSTLQWPTCTIVIEGNFRGRKLSWIGDFGGENYLLMLCQRRPLPQILQRKLLWMATKLWNLRKCSPSKVFHYIYCSKHRGILSGKFWWGSKHHKFYLLTLLSCHCQNLQHK